MIRNVIIISVLLNSLLAIASSEQEIIASRKNPQVKNDPRVRAQKDIFDQTVANAFPSHIFQNQNCKQRNNLMMNALDNQILICNLARNNKVKSSPQEARYISDYCLNHINTEPSPYFQVSSKFCVEDSLSLALCNNIGFLASCKKEVSRQNSVKKRLSINQNGRALAPKEGPKALKNSNIRSDVHPK